MSRIKEFFSRLWATIQCLLAVDRQTPEDRRRMRVNDQMRNYWLRRKKNEVTSIPLRARSVKSDSDWKMESKALEAVIKRETLEQLKQKEEIQRQYYKLTLAATTYRAETYAYAYVQASKRSAVVFLYGPSLMKQSYQAYWMLDDEVICLKEQETFRLAERILAPVVQAA